MQHYFVRQRGRVTGPYELPQILKMRDQGRLTRVHELSKNQEDWLPAFEFEEVFRSYVEMSEPELAMAPNPALAGNDNLADGVDWFYVFEGDRLGPVKKEQLNELVSQGEIKADTLVWCTDLADWSPASTVPQIAHLLGKSKSVDNDRGSSREASLVECANCGASIHPASTRCPTCGIARSSKVTKRAVYITLALSLGLFGIHNFYAGRMKEAIIQLLIIILLGWILVGVAINVVWILVECFFVTTDGHGRAME